MKTYDVVVLGAGMSGMLALHMLNRKDIFNVLVLEKNGVNLASLPSFYIHEHIPLYAEEEILIKYGITSLHKKLADMKAAYAMKIYNKNYATSVSIKKGKEKGWLFNKDILSVYNKISVKTFINVINIDPAKNTITYKEYGMPIKSDIIKYKYLINTIPQPHLLHLMNYKSAPIVLYPNSFIYYKIEKLGIPPAKNLEEKSVRIEYFPDLRHDYYRKTFYWFSGIVMTESMCPIYDYILKPGKIFDVPEAIKINAELTKLNIFNVGRYACWQRKYLMTNTYKDLVKIINKIKKGK